MKPRPFNKNKIIKKQGFTLPELLIASFILVIAFMGIMLGYVTSMKLAETSRNATKAVVAVKSKMEEIKDTPFASLASNYDSVTFTNPSLDGIGISYIDDTDPELFVVTVSFCWRQTDGRIIGECSVDGATGNLTEANFDGDGIMDSPVQIVSAILQ